MFINYCKVAWRNLKNNKFYSAINISGLAVGLATGIILLLWVNNELSYDKFHKDYESIYRLSTHFTFSGDNVTWNGVPAPLAVFAKSIPKVQSVVRTATEFDQVLSDKNKEKVFDGNRVAFADTSFFSMFTFPLLSGNATTVFRDAHTVVITESTARKLFGGADAVGKTMGFHKELFTVTGIVRDFPENSSISCDAILPMSYYASLFAAQGGNGDWKTLDEDLGNYGFTTYVKLQPGANPMQVGQTFTSAYKKARNGSSEAVFTLQNLADIHLVSADGNNSDLKLVRIFMLIVVLLLLIATINYINLSTARSIIRAKEVSIRKIIGAQKAQLFLQFTIETVVLFCFATAIAMVLIYLLMPFSNNISGRHLAFNIEDKEVWKVIGLAVSGTLVASSIFPAVLLSSFNPIDSLKGKFSSAIGITSFRKVLVVFQFAISVILLVCTIIMSNQMKFMKNKNLGYDKNYVFSVPLTQEVTDHLDAVKTELKTVTGIVSVAASDAYNLSGLEQSTGDIDWPGKPATNNMIITQLSADEDFIPAMKMKFIAGVNFTGTPADSSHFILNEAAVQKMGLKKPYIGQQVSFHDNKGTILGVVQDFNFQSLKEKIGPLIFYNNRNNKNILYVRTTAAHAPQAIAAAQAQYKKYAGDAPFRYAFLDKSFDDQYKSDQRISMLFNVFAGIAIFISCLGLFGLATYTAQVKTKEIGIRKVLGASVSGIVQLISADFLKLVVIAIVVAVPLAWWAMSKWLQGFAYRTDISWWVFAIAGLFATVIAVLTVSLQAIKAAIANPVKSLRTE